MKHIMEFVVEHEGTEEWHCPTCGRRFLVTWQPEFVMDVIEIGDSFVSHSGSRGGLTIIDIKMQQDNDK